MSEHRIIRVGLAGFGMSATIFQIPFLTAHPDYTLAKIYRRGGDDIEPTCPGARIVRSFEALLEDDIDLVVLSVPNALHYPLAKQALLAGRNVVAEKPLCRTAAEALELAALARERHCVLTVYQNRRLDGDFLTVRKLIDTGRLGEVLDYEAHYDRYAQGVSGKAWKAAGGPGVNVLYDLGVHIIDQAYTLFGMPDEVYADLRKERPESGEFDNFEVILYYPNRKAVLCAGEQVIRQGPHFMVNGRQGTFIKYGEDVQEAALIAGKRPPSADWGLDTPENYGTLYTLADGKVQEEKIPTERGDYTQFYSRLYPALTAGSELFVKPEQCADVLRILEAAIESNARKCRIPMK